LYLATRLLLETGLDPSDVPESIVPTHHDMNWEQTAGGQRLKLDFLWAPAANRSMAEALERLRANGGRRGPPSVLVVGCATWSIRDSNDSVQALELYKKNLTSLRPVRKLVNKLF